MTTDDLTPAGTSAVRLALTVTRLRSEIDHLTRDRDRWQRDATSTRRHVDDLIGQRDEALAVIKSVRALADDAKDFDEIAEGWVSVSDLRALLPATTDTP